MIYCIATFIIALLAFSYRSGGSVHPWGTQVNRIISWGIPCGLVSTYIAYVHELPLWYGVISGLLAFISHIFGHSSEQTDDGLAHIEMGMITICMLFLTMVPFMFSDLTYWVFVLTPLGFLSAFAYWLGYRMTRPFNLFGIHVCVVGDVSWGEFYTGAMAFGLPLAILSIVETL